MSIIPQHDTYSTSSLTKTKYQNKSSRQMNYDNNTIFFRKDYKLMIHSITLQEQVRATYFTSQCADYTTIPNGIFNICINNTIDFTTIDITTEHEEIADLQVNLDISHFAKGIKNDLGKVMFRVDKEKVLAPSSVNFYTTNLTNRKGQIEYKFVGYKKKQITEEQLHKFNQRKQQVISLTQQLQQNSQLKRLIEILDGKDHVIKNLQQKIASLIEQTRKLTHSLQREQSQEKKKLKQGLNLNLNINASNNYHMKKLNDKLAEENQYLQKRLDAIEEDFEELERKLYETKCENNILQIQLGKKQVEPQIIVNPTSRNYERQRSLDKISQSQYDQELQKKSKLADSMFMTNVHNNDNASVKQARNKAKRNQTMQIKDTSMLLSSLTPRGRSRTISMIQPHNFGNIGNSKHVDQQQVMQQLKNLKQNLQTQTIQGNSSRYPKLEAAIKSSYRMIQRLNDQKLILEQKLKLKQQQINYINNQLQRSKANFRSFQKQLRQRSSNAKDQFQQRMAAIKLQTQMRIAQMRKNNRFSDYESVMQQQKRQIQMQKMRFQNQNLKQKYQQALTQIKNLQAQKATEINKLKTAQNAVTKQKQMYKSKYYQMQDSYTKQQEQFSIVKEKALKFQIHLKRIQQLQSIEEGLKNKLQQEQKHVQDLVKKCKRFQDRFTQIEPKWDYYRQIQGQYEIIKRRNANLNKLNERFQSRLEELKKFTLRLQNAYYQKKHKNQSDEEFDMYYQKQMQDRIQQTIKKLRMYQRQFYEQQIRELTQSKKQQIQFYYKKIITQNQRIDQNPTYNEHQKQMFRSQKQHEINIIKQNKLDQLDKKIKTYEQLLAKLISSEQYLPKGLNEKISYLQQKLRKFELGQLGAGMMSVSSQSQMKNTIDRLNDSVRQKQSQITELKKTVGKMSDGSNLLRVNNIQTTFANQRKSMIQEMAKSRQIFSRSFEDLKKANGDLLKQKSTLQIQLQNYKFKQEKLMLKHQQRQRELQRVSKKNTEEFKRKITDLERALEKKSDENIKNKIQKEEFKENMTNLIGQLNTTANLLDKREQDVINLQAQNQQLKLRIEQYEQAQKTVMLQFKRIKQEAAFNQKQFQALLSQRNQNFIKIQKIKNTQIQKLKKTIEELQVKLETQITEILHTKKDLQDLQNQFQTIEAQLQQTKVSYNVANENYQKVQEESVLKIHELQETNELLERNLMQVAEQLRQTQMELHQAQINKQSLQLQVKSLQGLKGQISTQQIDFKKVSKKYEQIIQQQTQRLNDLSEKYRQIEHKVRSVQIQNKELNFKVINYETELEDLRQKMNRKYDQTNELKSSKVQSQLKNKYYEQQIERLKSQLAKAQNQLKSFENQNNQLKQQIEQFDRKNPKKVDFLNVNELTKSTRIKNKLNPPPKTLLMNSTNYDDLGMSKMMKSSRMNDLGASGVVNRKNIVAQQNKPLSALQEDQSLRGTQIDAQLYNEQQQSKQNIQSSQSIPQLRKRMWTVKEHDEQMLHSRGDRNDRASRVDLQYQQESQQQSDLQSQMSRRQQQNGEVQNNLGNRIKTTKQAIQLSQMVGDNWKQAESMSQNAILEEYLREIQNLKIQNKRISEEKQHLEQQNNSLKQRISSLTGNFEESERKNLLTSALGLTGGLLMKQISQRQSRQKQNTQNPGIPVMKIRSGTQSPHLSPQIGSKQTIRIEEHDSIHESRRGSRMSNKSQNSPGLSPNISQRGNSTIQKGSSNGNKNQISQNIINGFAKSSVQQLRSSRRQSLQGNRGRMTNSQIARVKQLQLLAQQLQEQNRQLRHTLQQQHSNNQKLMEQLVVIQQSQQQQNKLLNEKIQQIQQLTQFYQKIKQQLQGKIEKLVEEQIEKQGEEIKLLKTFDVKNEEIDSLNRKIEYFQKQLGQKIQQIEKLTSQKQRAYVQYRKYQQQSQLQILRLKQQLTAVKQTQSKTRKQVELIAEDYFQLQQTKNQLQQDLGQKDIVFRRKDTKLQQITSLYEQTKQQLKKLQQGRRSFNKLIFDLQNQLTQKDDQMAQVNKATSMLIKKYQIKLNTNVEQTDRLKQKLHQRDNIVQTLKHQIALYNDETEKLKQLNKQLSLQLQRTQKQLKDIMKSYQTQFSNINLDVKSQQQSLKQYKLLLTQKDSQISNLNKLIKKLENETRNSFESEHQIKQVYDKYKQAKQKEIHQINAQLEIKNNQYLKLKTVYEKETEEFFTKQSQYLKKLSQQQQSKKGFKQKLIKYQTVLQQLQKQLSIMSQRPTKQQYDEMQFQNQLYKNRIQQLQEMLREFAPQAQANRFKDSEEGIQLQYKKYKLQKQRELDDLSNQIEKYALKINQLEENNFMMKKHIEKIKLQMKEVLEKNSQLRDEIYDLKEDLAEMNQQMEFYKGKRIQNLSKLLNQTM